MPSGTLLLAGAVGAVAGTVFLVVGELVRRRDVEVESRPAARAFALFWYAIGAHAILLGLADVAAALDAPPTPFYPALRIAAILLAAAGLAGLSSYLLYLFTGRRGWWKGVAALYVAAAALGVAQVARRNASASVEIGRWSTDLYASSGSDPAAYALTVLLFLLPPLVGALAYARLANGIEDPAPRLRVRLVSTAIFGWFAGVILSRLSDHDLWLFLTRPVLGLAVAATVLYAYRGPRRREAAAPAPAGR